MPKMTFDEYMAWENEQPDRHEFYRGEIYAMSGVRFANSRVTGNLFKRIDDHIDGTECTLFVENFKLRLADEACFYPDLMVTCSQKFSMSDLTVTEPLLIIEVVSPSTERYDRGDKFTYYRSFPTLREYALIDPDKRSVEVHTLTATGAWERTDQTGRAMLGLASIDLEIPLTQVFKGVTIDAA